jgi:hypothetical protein
MDGFHGLGHFAADGCGAVFRGEAPMTRPERRWCGAYSLALVLATTLPVWIAFRHAGSEWGFSGFLFAVEDGNSYIAKMQLGAAGAWLFRSPYTAMPQRGVIAFLPYLLLGKLAAPPETHLQLVLLFHLFRIAMIPVVVIAVYRLAGIFLATTGSRRWATILGTAGGGLGWMLTFTGSGGWLGSLPLDFISPESFGFLAMLTLPHLILTRALLLFALAAYLTSGMHAERSWTAGLLLALSTLVQPLGTITAFAVVATHQILLWLRSGRQFLLGWRARWLPVLWRLVVPSLPLLLYYIVSSISDPYLQVWAAQNQLPSPHPLHYVLAYGLVLPFAALAAVRAWRTASTPELLLVGWVVILPILAYFPYPVQRRLPEGVWVALSILAITGLFDWLRDRSLMRWLRPGLVGFSTLSSLALVIGSTGVASDPARPAFITHSDEQAFAWLGDHADPGSIVLASHGTSNALPAWTPVRVLIGLGPESAYHEQLEPQIEAFFNDGMSTDERQSFLIRERVKWIVMGPLEAKIGDWRPGIDTPVILRYSDADYRIYEVGGGK